MLLRSALRAVASRRQRSRLATFISFPLAGAIPDTIDIHDPVRNANYSGFLPEERAWITSFLESGFIDTFRHFNQEPHHYTWWSYRFKAREKDIGWRLDYFFISENLRDALTGAFILKNVYGSDHCPVGITLKTS